MLRPVFECLQTSFLVFFICDFHIWWIIGIPPLSLLFLIIISVWNNIYPVLIWKQEWSPIRTTLLKISLTQTKTWSIHLLAHSRANTHFARNRNAPSHMHACMHANTVHSCTYTSLKNTYIYTLTQRPFISLFISIISHNYNSVLSGSSELESKCLVLARSYISHSRTGGGSEKWRAHE